MFPISGWGFWEGREGGALLCWEILPYWQATLALSYISCWVPAWWLLWASQKSWLEHNSRPCIQFQKVGVVIWQCFISGTYVNLYCIKIHCSYLYDMWATGFWPCCMWHRAEGKRCALAEINMYVSPFCKEETNANHWENCLCDDKEGIILVLTEFL